eukprot:c19207_g2_i1.p1 GENE.c19207_g2_i1~~c19207_g2_i1.p1  ORF type:complete len:207 (-),score=74.62 c19207_g2_i1:173-793(-)
MSEPELHEILKERGNQLFQKGKYDAAIDAYTEAICLSPNHSTYYTNRGLCYYKKEDFQQTIENCDTAIKLDPNSIKAHYFKGNALERMNHINEALEVMGKALEICNKSENSKEKITYEPEIISHLKKIQKKRADIILHQKMEQYNKKKSEILRLLNSDLEYSIYQLDLDKTITPQEREERLSLIKQKNEERKMKDKKICKRIQMMF